jgi:hypothetical protein
MRFCANLFTRLQADNYEKKDRRESYAPSDGGE